MKLKPILPLLIAFLLALVSFTQAQQLGQYAQSTGLNMAEFIPAGNSTQALNLTAAPKQVALQAAWVAFGVTNTGTSTVYVSNTADANTATALAVLPVGATVYRLCASNLWLWSPQGSSVTFTGYVHRTPSSKAAWLAVGGLRPCADYVSLSHGTVGNQYKDCTGFSRVQYTTSGAVTRLRLVYPGWWINAGSGDAPMPNTQRVQAAIEYPAGTYTRVTFTGSANGVNDPSGYVLSDPVFITIPAQTAFFVRTYEELLPLYTGTLNTGASAGGTLILPASIPNDPNLVGATLVITGGTGGSGLQTGHNYRNACKIASTSVVSGNVNLTQDATLKTAQTTDATSTFAIYASPSIPLRFTGEARNTNDQQCAAYLNSGANYVTTPLLTSDFSTYTGTASSGIYVYAPAAVLGDSPVPSVAILGDSIIEGQYSSAQGGTGPNGAYGAGYGELNLFSAPGAPSFGLAKLSESNGKYADYTNGTLSRRLALATLCDYAIVGYGINDVYSGTTLANLKTYALNLWSALASAGVQVYACTIPPRTTDPSGLWISAASQTPQNAGDEAVRVAFNTWLRTNPAPLTGVFDVAANVEVNPANVFTLNGGCWYVGPNFPINAGMTSSTATGGSATTLIDTVNLPNASYSHFIGQVVQVTHAGTSYTGIVTNYNASTQTLTCSGGFSSSYVPVLGDTYVILGGTSTATPAGAGIHPNDYGTQLMAAAINPGLFMPVARINTGIAGWLSLSPVPLRAVLKKAS